MKSCIVETLRNSLGKNEALFEGWSERLSSAIRCACYELSEKSGLGSKSLEISPM